MRSCLPSWLYGHQTQSLVWSGLSDGFKRDRYSRTSIVCTSKRTRNMPLVKIMRPHINRSEFQDANGGRLH